MSKSVRNKRQSRIPLVSQPQRRTITLFFLVILLVIVSSLISPTSGFAPSLRSRPIVHYFASQTSSRGRRLALVHEVQDRNGVNGSNEAPLSPDEEAFYISGIQPKTNSLPKSMGYYAHFVISRLKEQREKRRKKRRRGLLFWKRRKEDVTEEKVSLWKSLKILNEQRRNVVNLAGYNAGIVVPSFAFLLLGALTTSIIPHFYSDCITCVATSEPSRLRTIQALTGLAVTSTLGALFTGLRGSLFWIAGSRANYNVRVKLHRNLLLQEAAFFDSNETGYLLSRLNNDVNKIGMVISFHVNLILRQFAQFLFGSVYLVRISPGLSLYAFGGIFLVAIVSAIYGAFARDLAQRVQDTFADATAVAETSFSMSETIRAFDGVDEEYHKYEGAQSNALRLEEVQAWAYGSHKFVSDTLQTMLQAALLLACWTVGRAGGLPSSKLTTFLFYTNFVLESSNEVGDQWAKIQSAVGASSSVFNLIRRIPQVRDPPLTTPHAVGPVERREPVITMKNMTISYGTMDVPALNGIDLNVYEGDRIAIVGRSGSGKSSMLRSILRFYDPSSGSISLYGKDLKTMTRKEIASKVTVVEQEPHLFPMTLIENLLYGIEKDAVDPETGKPCYSEEYRKLVSDSLRLAGLPIDANNDLGLELDTRVGEGGRTLSGGQRQRATIARALIRKPEVLLLDEPTAALDSQSEKKVVKALRAAMEVTKCMVMVTHRLSVVRSLDVNRVLVLEKGRIVESGHPEELLRKENGLYAAMAREQGITSQPTQQEPSRGSSGVYR